MPDTQTPDSDTNPIPLSTKQPARTGVADHTDAAPVPLGDALRNAYDAVTDGEAWQESFTTYLAGNPLIVAVRHDGIGDDLELGLDCGRRSASYSLSEVHPSNAIRTALSRPADFVSVDEASPECGRETLNDLLQSNADTAAFRVEFFGFVDYFEVDLDYGNHRYAQVCLAPGEPRYRRERVRIDGNYHAPATEVMSTALRMLSNAHATGGSDLRAYVSPADA